MSLTFCHSIGGYPAQVLTEIVAEYNKDHTPNIELKSIKPNQAVDELAKPPHERAAFVLAHEFTKGAMCQALKDRVAISVKSLLDVDNATVISEFAAKTFGEDFYPFTPACGILYINKTLLKEKGFDPDWQPDSFEELIEMSKSLGRGFTCAWPEAYLVEVMLAQKDLPLLTAEGKYDFCQLKAHILHLRQLVKEGVLLLPPVGNYDPTRQSFIKGEAAFYFQGSGHWTIIDKEAKEAGVEVGYAPVCPLSEGLTASRIKAFPLGGAFICVLNTNAEDTDFVENSVQGVREFLNYLASQKIQAHWHEKTAYVPASTSVRRALGEEFYRTHPVHDAVIKQTIEAPFGDNSFGIKKENYHIVRAKLYPLIRDLLLLEGNDDEAAAKVEERLRAFEEESNR
jgi:maltose-binding protein MalE